MCSPPCTNQAISQPPFDGTVDNSLADRKCANTPFSMQKIQAKKEVSKKKVLALYEDYLKKRVKEAGPNARMGNRLFKEIKAKGYLGSFSTVKKFLRRVRGDFPKETSLPYYKDYLKKRFEEAQPNYVSTRKLFAEITVKGYRGSFGAVENFLWVIRKQTKASEEASIQFHKEYLIKRLKDAPLDSVSGRQLFKEIRAKGYRGSANTLQTFLSALRKQAKKPSEVSLNFHKGYLIKRIKDFSPGFVSGRQLFEEIRAKGYRGSIITLRGFLAALRKQEKTPSEDLSHASVEFHRGYLTKRLEKTYPKYPSGTELFKEIRAKGYRGSLSTLQMFLSTLRKEEKRASEACVEFHRDYLTERLEKTYPKYPSGRELFQEIRAKGYRGSISTLQIFLSTLRKQEQRPSEACIEFHKEYLSKRLEETYPKCVSGTELFKEISAKGYQGSPSTLRAFLSILRKQEESPNKESSEVDRNYSIKRLDKSHSIHTQQLFEGTTDSEPYENALPKQLNIDLLACRNALSEASLQFHKDYLIKRIQETWPSCLSPEQLFEEIILKGYRGTCKEVEVFLMMIFK